MPKSDIYLPFMYADHHITEVRRILFELDGVDDVLASSALRMVQVQYDAARIDEAAIQAALAGAGYTEPLAVPVETDFPASKDDATTRYFRHSTAFQHAKSAVSFSQEIVGSGRPLWPCPGMGVIRAERHEEDISDG